jgi:hypothetical protein
MGKQHPVLIGYETRWATEKIWMWQQREKACISHKLYAAHIVHGKSLYWQIFQPPLVLSGVFLGSFNNMSTTFNNKLQLKREFMNNMMAHLTINNTINRFTCTHTHTQKKGKLFYTKAVSQ